MILSTCEFIANKKITENLGIARGSTVRARNAMRDLMAGLKSVVGGEIEEYTKLQAYAREQAVERMITDAKDKGANAIICFRIQSSTSAQGASEVVAYGTGVILED